jgi:RNA polymerase sigma factor (sigma-70 family)
VFARRRRRRDARVVGWLVLAATREAWRGAGGREIPVGAWQPEAVYGRELPESAADGPGPLDSALEHEDSDALRDRLGTLTGRERQFLALQGAGLSYREIAVRMGVTVRTVERQVLRGRRKLDRGGSR